MLILIITISIFILTSIFWAVKRYLLIDICPICSGVFLTWFIFLILMLTGKISVFVFQMPIALLMGGSIVGIAYKLESKIKEKKSILLFKSLFIPIGFALAYSLVTSSFYQAVFIFVILGIITLIFLKFRSEKKEDDLEKNKKVEDLLGKMKNCC